MKLCYQVATPDVAIAPSVTAFQGDMDYTFGRIAAIGYDGMEFMTLDPNKLDWDLVLKTSQKYRLCIPLVCTGEVFGQLGLSFTDPDEAIRTEAVKRVKDIIDFAGFLGANINIGRVRGQYRHEVPQEQTREWAIKAFREIGNYAAPKNVMIAIESVTILQTNFINTISEACEMVDAVDHPNFKIMMDVFHMNIEEKNICDSICKYKDYNIHVHLADNNRRYPGHCGMDFRKIVSTFKECGYDGAFCTEIFQLPDQEQAAKGSVEHLAPIFAEFYGRDRKS